MPDGFLTALAAASNAFLLVGSVYIYLSVLRQIGAREVAHHPASGPTFALPDAVLALALATLFAINAASATRTPGEVVLRTSDLVANALVSLALFLFVAAFLVVRGRNVSDLAGFGRLKFRRVFITAGVLLFAA